MSLSMMLVLKKKKSRAHFPDNMYDVMTTNIVESLNSMLIHEREYPIASIFNSISKTFENFFRESHNNMAPSSERIAEKKDRG